MCSKHGYPCLICRGRDTEPDVLHPREFRLSTKTERATIDILLERTII